MSNIGVTGVTSNGTYILLPSTSNSFYGGRQKFRSEHRFELLEHLLRHQTPAFAEIPETAIRNTPAVYYTNVYIETPLPTDFHHLGE